MRNDISLNRSVIPDLIKPAADSIRGNPLFEKLVPGFRRDDVWIVAFAGMRAQA